MPCQPPAQGTLVNYFCEFSMFGVSSTDPTPPSTGRPSCPPGCPPFVRSPVDCGRPSNARKPSTREIGDQVREPHCGPDVDVPGGAQRCSLGEVLLVRLGSVGVRERPVGTDH